LGVEERRRRLALEARQAQPRIAEFQVWAFTHKELKKESETKSSTGSSEEFVE